MCRKWTVKLLEYARNIINLRKILFMFQQEQIAMNEQVKVLQISMT